MGNYRNKIKCLSEKLGDNISKNILEDRLFFDWTNDSFYARKMTNTIAEGKLCEDRLKKSKNRVIWGSGMYGKHIKDLFPELSFKAYIDNDKEKTEIGEYNGLPIIFSEEFLKNYSGELVVIASRVYNQQIYKQMTEAGIKKENIFNLGEIIDKLTYKQYFDLDFLIPGENESFIDGGSLDGRSSEMFIKWCNGKYKKIWAFEPDPSNINKCICNFAKKNIKKYEIIPKCMWNQKGNVKFKMTADGMSMVSPQGNIEVETCKIDDIVGTEQVTFIKMDIEGSEYEALQGARETIIRQHPKLAICVYHKIEDVINIADLLLTFNPQYRFYIRHYSLLESETVLYAI